MGNEIKQGNPEGQPEISTKPNPALIRVLQTGRNVKAYGVTENEIEQLGMFNTLTTIFFSVGTGVLTFGVGLFVNWIMAGMPSSYGEVLAKVGGSICIIMGVVFYVVGIILRRQRKSTIQRIKTDSFPIDR